jgi:SAM-dependent methyltransferase
MYKETAERVSLDEANNYVLQRSIKAYIEAAKLTKGIVLELGTGSGYGIEIVAPKASKFITLDKFRCEMVDNLPSGTNVEFIQMTFPPLSGIANESVDYVISFQVIEHIENDNEFVKEIARILKPGGRFICTTPNIKMSLTRNPWHIREYTIEELNTLLKKHFAIVDKHGIFNGPEAMKYYEENKKSVRKIMRFDIFNLQYRLPRQILQWPFDILNRLNRKKLYKSNASLSDNFSPDNYYLELAKEDCIDLFYIATK